MDPTTERPNASANLSQTDAATFHPSLRMLTGDHPAQLRHCLELAFILTHRLNREFAPMAHVREKLGELSDEALKARSGVFVLCPNSRAEQKIKIIRALQDRGAFCRH